MTESEWQLFAHNFFAVISMAKHFEDNGISVDHRWRVQHGHQRVAIPVPQQIDITWRSENDYASMPNSIEPMFEIEHVDIQAWRFGNRDLFFQVWWGWGWKTQTLCFSEKSFMYRTYRYGKVWYNNGRITNKDDLLRLAQSRWSIANDGERELSESLQQIERSLAGGRERIFLSLSDRLSDKRFPGEVV